MVDETIEQNEVFVSAEQLQQFKQLNIAIANLYNMIGQLKVQFELNSKKCIDEVCSKENELKALKDSVLVQLNLDPTIPWNMNWETGKIFKI